MRTIVYQSYRRENVPPWIARCLTTAREWALLRGFEYAFIDDQLFDYAPLWYRERVGGHILPIADLARLALAREFLDSGYERTIWIDADVLVFAPQSLSIAVTEGYAFCNEVWLEQVSETQVSCSRRVNNAITVFTKDGGHVDFFIDAAKSLVRNKQGEVRPWDVSTVFLTALHSHIHFPLIRNLGLFSPPVLLDIARGGGPFAEAYQKQFGQALVAANLCSSLRNKLFGDVLLDDEFFQHVVDRLLESHGEIINRYVSSPTPTSD